MTGNSSSWIIMSVLSYHHSFTHLLSLPRKHIYVLPVSIYTCWENSKTYSSLPYALIILFSKNLLVYYYKCCNLIGYANRYLFVNRYRVARQATFFVKKQCLFLDFRNHFKERTNTSLFLLKQLDYSLEISMKRYS